MGRSSSNAPPAITQRKAKRGAAARQGAACDSSRGSGRPLRSPVQRMRNLTNSLFAAFKGRVTRPAPMESGIEPAEG